MFKIKSRVGISPVKTTNLSYRSPVQKAVGLLRSNQQSQAELKNQEINRLKQTNQRYVATQAKAAPVVGDYLKSKVNQNGQRIAELLSQK